mmetsp:Transcript_96025/g.275711  ORF Transcript_96025/g.275711 Transcript_96025/m.275711 type:complete len:551 (-) Transcript_96025:139-1791(-)
MGCGGSKKVTRTAPELSLLTSNHANNEDIRDKYELGAVLGSGSFGQVREASLTGAVSSEMRAVKMIERDNEDGEWSNQAIFIREVGLLQTIQHENIIRYYDFYEDVHFLYVVMELCKGGEVFAKIVELKRFSEKNAAALGQQMLKAIMYIHGKSIAHRDIKAENFMLSEPFITSQVKMIDFGMACKFKEGEVLTELCGSPHYLAPELIGQKYNHRADVWAFGVLLYLIMYGHYPYDAKHPRDIMVKILTEPIQWQKKVKLSPDGLGFLKRLLEHEPKKRMTPEESLVHPWMALANDTSKEEGEVIATAVLRSALKKVTATRKPVDPKIEQLRNKKLKQIDEDFTKGIRQGHRLGETPREAYMSKPEFVRRDSKITTAPSRDCSKRRTSVQSMLATLSGGSKGKASPGNLGAIGKRETDKAEDAAGARGGSHGFHKMRSSSLGGGGNNPRRLSYIGALSKSEERNFASMYSTGKPSALPAVSDEELAGVVPGERCEAAMQSEESEGENVPDPTAAAVREAVQKHSAREALKGLESCEEPSEDLLDCPDGAG